MCQRWIGPLRRIFIWLLFSPLPDLPKRIQPCWATFDSTHDLSWSILTSLCTRKCLPLSMINILIHDARVPAARLCWIGSTLPHKIGFGSEKWSEKAKTCELSIFALSSITLEYYSECFACSQPFHKWLSLGTTIFCSTRFLPEFIL